MKNEQVKEVIVVAESGKLYKHTKGELTCSDCLFNNIPCPTIPCGIYKEVIFEDGEFVEKVNFEKGEIIEVTDKLPWPEYPTISRFHSIGDDDEYSYVAMGISGGIGAEWRYARKFNG